MNKYYRKTESERFYKEENLKGGSTLESVKMRFFDYFFFMKAFKYLRIKHFL